MTQLTDWATAIELYRQMLRIRMVEERIADLYAEQEMRCPVHLCIGQEAIAVGMCAELTVEDYVMSGHRSHGHYLAKGGDLNAMFAEIYGKATGCCMGRGGSMHLVDLAVGYLGSSPIVGSTIPIAAGAAFGSALLGRSQVTVVFFGDGATEEGRFHESLNFATLWNLPVIFVCENNLYSVYSPQSVRQPPSRDLVMLGRGHGITSERGDGNNVDDVYRLASAAVARARGSEGPTLLQFDTYRLRDHVGPDDDTGLGYRSPAELQQWVERSPLDAMANRLVGDGAISRSALEEFRSAFDAEIDDAVRFAKESPFPDAAEMGTQVYAP